MTLKPTHLLAAALITALILACFAAPAAALDGSGTAESPYLISSLTDLQSFRDSVNNGATTSGKYWQLTTDIDISGSTWNSIGTYNYKFQGVFNGDGHKIIIGNTNINRYTYNNGNYYYSGFFGYVNHAIIQNLELEVSSEIITNYESASTNGFSPLCGYSSGNTQFSKIYVHGTYIFENTYNSNVGSSVSIGGILGATGAGQTIINNCISDIDISASATRFANCGGIVGNIFGSGYVSLTNTVSYGEYVGTGSVRYPRMGGLIGISDIQNGGSISDSVSLLSSLSGTPSDTILKRVYVEFTTNDFAVDNIYGLSTMLINGQTVSTSKANGLDVTPATAATQSFYKDTLGWDFTNTWYWDSETNTPQLIVFRDSIPLTIFSISATPATGGQLTEYTLSIIATTEAEGGIASYQWSYSTDSGQTWQPISGANTASYVWQPGQSISGDVLLKCLVTGADGGTVDSYAAGYTNIQITIVPPPEIDSVSASRPLQKINTPTTLTATFGDIQTGNTYQWYYSTNGGTTWQAISGATQPTAQYTPTTTGLHNIKIVVTTQYGDTTETATSITVLPTYTPTPITQTTFDVSIDATAKYQGAQQFELSAELKALNYYTPTLAHLAHDNALYYLDSAALEVIPVSTTTGGTISAAYLGEYTGIITDTAGNTAFYSYQTNDWQYIEQDNAQIIASTASYAATVSGGTLRIYNANGNLVATTATTAANLAGNDQTNVFVSYSGSTLTYYWVNGNSISSATQTVTNAITELHQISGTNNFIISTAKNTVIAEISDTGVYSLVATSNTDTPLIHTQATSINIFIGVAAPNEIFIIGADGETDGTYVTGSTLSDASIAKSTGLFAIAGGADYQAYILSKSESSVWQLAQVVAFGEAIDYSQISTTGTYAAVSTGLKLYLLEAKDTDTSTYYLQGVVIGSTGKPYAGKTISINDDTIRTDTNGMFLYPVQPGKLLIITAGDTTVEYTPSNAALQQIAIRIKAGLLSTEVTYNAEYSAEAQAIVMSYDDSAGKTTAVSWNVYETANNTLLATYTGNSASFPVAPGDVYNNYYVQLSADRGAATVANTWSITPAGGQPVDLYGLDEDGRNIIFGFLLLLLAGLFGVMHSRSGAILVAFAACIMRYLELITIPWILIIIAVVLAIVAAIAHGGQNQ